MIGRKKKLTPEEQADFIPTFRYGIFDESGIVSPMYISNSKKIFKELKIPEGTKPFQYPMDDETYVPVYLMGNELLKREFSRDGIWLDAELCFSNFELSGSLTGKLAETYQRVGDIKSRFADTFSLRANIFIVLFVIAGGIALFYGIGKLVFG
jgi:hypothetical protein